MDQDISDVGFDPQNCTTEQVLTAASSFCQDQGFEYFSFLTAKYAASDSFNTGAVFHANYDGAWVDRYCENRYDLVDPLPNLARQSFVSGDDLFLRKVRKCSRRLFHECREFGIRYRASFPVHCADGSIHVVSFSTAQRSSFCDAFHANPATLHLAAHNLTDVLGLGQKRGDQDVVKLAVREREALCWAADGLTSEQVASHMSITVSAVNYHLGNATRKLGAHSRHHAAICALRQSLI